jgi:hypothetical protein
MNNKGQTLKGFILGVLAAVATMAIMGTVNQPTENVSGDTGHSFQNVSASSDGKTVYVCDNVAVYRSTDGGTNWAVVLKKQ